MRSDSRSAVSAGFRPRKLEAQPLLNHERRSYGSCAYTALNDHRTLTCSYLDTERSAQAQPTVVQTAPTTYKTRPSGPGLTCGFLVAGPGFEPRVGLELARIGVICGASARREVKQAQVP